MESFAITDMNHYSGFACGKSRPTHEIAELLGFMTGIISSLRAAAPGRYSDTGVVCGEYVDGAICHGAIVAMRTDVPAQIRWRCAECGRSGIIVNWKDFPGVLDAPVERVPRGLRICQLILSGKEFEFLLTRPSLDFDTSAVIRMGVKDRRGILIYGSEAELACLREFVEGCRNSQADGPSREILAAIAEKIDRMM